MYNHEMLKGFDVIGIDVLNELIKQDKIEHRDRTPRKYSSPEAAEILGRSTRWLRDEASHIELAGNGRRYFSLEQIDDIRQKNGLDFKKPEGKKAIVKAIMNFKGGVGKSTTTLHEAHYMATYKGMNVLVIDLDPQASSTFSISSMIPDIDVKKEDTVFNAMTREVTDCADIFQSSYVPNLDFVPSGLVLQPLESELILSDAETTERMGFSDTRLNAILELVNEHYDLILIDCPPSMGQIAANAIYASDAMLITVPPSLYDVGSVVLLNNTVATYLESVDKALHSYRVLVTKDPNTSTSKRNEAKIRRIFGDCVYENTVPQTTEFDKASENFTTIYDLNRELTNKQSYEKAVERLNSVHEGIYEDYMKIWEAK